MILKKVVTNQFSPDFTNCRQGAQRVLYSFKSCLECTQVPVFYDISIIYSAEFLGLCFLWCNLLYLNKNLNGVIL